MASRFVKDSLDPPGMTETCDQSTRALSRHGRPRIYSEDQAGHPRLSLFEASVTPDGTTPNALDVSLGLSLSGLSASAQDLTQSAELDLDAPRLLTGAVQDRLISSGGALGEGASTGAKGVAGFSFGNANIWARGADEFGSATAQAASASVGYDINRAAPFIAGVDWRLDNGIVAGVAATYVATSAKSRTARARM
ncbi:MAG: autotransporter domain-containing protein [Hyphomicrobiales bacterium]|nr:autotransporter domain-containing protein [Hyphomicrobiales bacterium]